MSLPDCDLDPPEPRIVDCCTCGIRDIEDNMSRLDGAWLCGACATGRVKE